MVRIAPFGGSVNGERPDALGSIGELTDVASAKRAVRGLLNVNPDEELDDVRVRTRTVGFFTSFSELCRIGCWSLDMLVNVPAADVRLSERAQPQRRSGYPAAST